MGYITGIDPTQTWESTDVPGFANGQCGMNADGSEYVFVQMTSGQAATGAGYWCHMTASAGTITAQQISTTTSTPGTNGGMPCGVAMAAIPTSGFGWLCVRGWNIPVRVAASAAKATILNTTATAGQLDDDATAGAEVMHGAVLTAANGGAAGNANAHLMYPVLGRTL